MHVVGVEQATPSRTLTKPGTDTSCQEVPPLEVQSADRRSPKGPYPHLLVPEPS